MQKTVYEVPGIWSLKVKRIGRMKRFLKNKDMVSELSLQPGICRLGTGWFNDIRIYGCKSKVKLFKLGDQHFFCDVTWDLRERENGRRYQYYMLTEKQMRAKSHPDGDGVLFPGMRAYE